MTPMSTLACLGAAGLPGDWPHLLAKCLAHSSGEQYRPALEHSCAGWCSLPVAELQPHSDGAGQCRVLTSAVQVPRLNSSIAPALPHQGLPQQQLTPAGNVCAVRGQC